MRTSNFSNNRGARLSIFGRETLRQIAGVVGAVACAVALNACAPKGGGSSSSSSSVSGAPGTMYYASNPAYYPISAAIMPNTVTANKLVGSFTVSPALPAGLALDPASGTISGTPTVAQSPVTYTVTGTNSYGENVASITIGVVNGAPSISYAGPYTGYRNVDFPTISPSSTGGYIESCSVSPSSLPAGLSFNASNCQISGTPTALSSSTTYTVTASNVIGNGTATFQLSVTDELPVLSYNPSTQNLPHNQPVTINITNTGGYIPAGGCAITAGGSLPAGLSFDSDTCTISGTPTMVTGSNTYTVQATNNAGSATTTLTLSVVVSEPVLTYSPGTYTLYDERSTNLPIVATLGGDPITGCVAVNTLPPGLSLNSSNCEITGTPTAAEATAYYTIEAVNAAGDSQTMVQITVDEIPPDITYSGSPYTDYEGKPSTAESPGNTGGPITSCSISPALPTGLSISNSCQISGTPTVSSPSTNYTVTASNSAGNSTATINITVDVPPNPPNLSYTAPATYTFTTDGDAISPTVNALNPSPAGAPTSCSVSPTLPTGLSVSATGSTCEISGTPTQVVGTTEYAVTGTNAGGTSTADVTVTVNDVPPVISYPDSPYYLEQNTLMTQIDVTNNATPIGAGQIVSCSSNPALPAGLALSSTCEITGTPTVLQALTNYTITATNSGGSDSANISIAVDALPTITPLANSTYPLDGSNPPLIQGDSYTIASASDPSGGNVTFTCTYETLGLSTSDPNYAASGTNCSSLPTLASVSSVTMAQDDAVQGSGTASPEFTWTPTDTQRGTYEFSFIATNSVGSTPAQTVIVTVREPDTGTNLLSGFDALDATNATGLSASTASAPFSSSASATSWLQLLTSPSDATLDFSGTPWGGTGQDSSSAVSPYSLSYNGTSDYLSVGSALDGSPAASKVAIETWVEPGSTSSATTTIAGNGGGIANGLAIRQSTIPTGHASFVVGQKYYSYQSLILNDQPSAFWRLNDSNTTAVDFTANYNTGTYQSNSSDYTESESGPFSDGADSVLLNGSSGYVSTATTYSTQPNVFTLEAWFKTSAAGGKIIGMGNAQTGESTNYDRHVYLGAHGEACFGVYPTEVETVCTPQSTSYADGNWHYVVAELSSAGMYISVDNGTPVTDSSVTTGQSYGSNSYWKIGYDDLDGWTDAPSNYYFSGYLADVAVYSYTLTTQQITNHYETGKTGGYLAYPGNPILADAGNSVVGDGLVGYWRLGEKMGTTAADDSGNSNTGTYQGGVTLGQTGALTDDSDTAVLLNGTSGYVSTATSFDDPTSFSIEVWFKTTSNSNMGLIGFSSSQTGNGTDNDRAISINGGQLSFTAGGRTVTYTTSTYNNGSWHQVVATCSSSSTDGMILYIDGTAEKTHSTCTPTNYTGYWRIGDEQGYGFFSGTVDEAAVYGYALGADEVQAHYNSGNGPGWWTCMSPTALSSSSWDLLQGVWDGTYATLYMNGQQQCQVEPGTTYSASAANTFAGADSSQDSSSFWQGLMSTLKFFGTSDGVTNPLPASSAYTDFATEANRFRAQPVENIVTSNLVLSYDAANALLGVTPGASGCSGSWLDWYDLSSSAENGLLTGFGSCGWTGSGTVSSPYALSLNGSSDYVSLTQGTNLGTTYTVEAWVLPSAISSNAGVVSNGTVYLGGSSGSKWQFNGAVSSSSGTTSQWSHVVGVQNGSSQILYVNGSAAGSASGSVTFNSGALDIGLNGATYFDGQIATLRIYNGALTQQQIQQNCLAQELRFTSTPESICAAP